MVICDRYRRLKPALGLSVALAHGAMAAVAANDRMVPLSPPEAMGTFQLEPGLRIELVAAEPLVVDPVAFAFDEDRRLYVVEGRGYPEPIGGVPVTHEGRVVILDDDDGDGRFDRRTEFATGLTYPNGVMPWRGGVFVTCAPDIYYLKDTNGDGVADQRQVVLTGFNSGKTSQLRVATPTLGFDGRVYVTSGLTGGEVTSPLHPERPPVEFSSPMDGRFNPDTLAFENTGGRGQFGLTFDAFGRRFVSSNRHPVIQIVLEPWHLRRNPHLAFTDMVQNVSKVEAEAKVYPISGAHVSSAFHPRLMATPHTGTFTSACSVMVFGGTGLSADHTGNVFICEPAQNLVQRQVTRLEGASLRSSPAYDGREFLASTDVWFRPVFVSGGPDGGLYIADMHRREIDHPQYLPGDARGKLDFDGGKGAGRIYRIVRDDGAAHGVKATPGKSVAELVRELESPDGWWRQCAYRLLIERGDADSVPLLEKLVTGSKRAESRVLALSALDVMDRLGQPVIVGGLRDSEPGVRERAVAVAGAALPKIPSLIGPLLRTAEDSNPRVRFAAALALGTSEDARVVTALASIAMRDGGDRWTRAAVLTGISTRMPEFLEAFDLSGNVDPRAVAPVMEDLGRIFGAGASLDACRLFLTKMLAGSADLPWRLPSVLGLLEGLQSRGDTLPKHAGGPLAGLLANGARRKGVPPVDGAKRRPDHGLPVRQAQGPEPVEGEAHATPDSTGETPVPPQTPATTRRRNGAPSDVNRTLDAFFGHAAQVAANEQASTAERLSAVTLLGHTEFERAAPVLAALLDARHPPELQLEAVRALDRQGDRRGGELLIREQNWTRYTPRIREAVISTLVSKPVMIEVLFAAIERGVIEAAEISSTRRTQLMKHSVPGIREEAGTLFKELESGDRMQVYQAYREILERPATPAAGKEVFVRVCSACHTYDGVGGKVGPDLSGVRNQPSDALLLHTLVPNYEVYGAYQSLTVTTQDGRTISGWLSAETEGGLTLRTAFGTEETVLRTNVASLAASGVSLMPDGLEQAMTKDELANLIAYLKSGSQAP